MRTCMILWWVSFSKSVRAYEDFAVGIPENALASFSLGEEYYAEVTNCMAHQTDKQYDHSREWMVWNR